MARENLGLELLEHRLLMTTLQVANTNDSGAGSLRAAIAAAQAGDTISLANVSGTIALASSLTISQDLRLMGPGLGQLSLSGGDSIRPLNIAGGDVSISDLTVTDGYTNSQAGGINVASGADLFLARVAITSSSSGTGGGMLVEGGASLTMIDSSVTGNSTTANGAGIFGSVNSTLILTRCTISGNSVFAEASDFGFPGMGEGGGLELLGSASTITNCTIANNTITAEDYTGGHPMTPGMEDGYARGAGIFMGNGAITITNCTIAGNSANATDVQGGGISWLGNGSLTLNNTIIAGNTGNTTPDAYIPTGTFSGSNNLIGKFTDSGLTHGVNGNQLGTLGSPLDAGLLTLADNGGKTQTIALTAQSPAIDAASATFAPGIDQRRLARNGAADIGAYEFGGTTPTPAIVAVTPARAVVGIPFFATFSTTSNVGEAIGTSVFLKPAWLQVTDNGDGTATAYGTPPAHLTGANYLEIHTDDGESISRRCLTIGVYKPLWAVNDDGVLMIHGTNGDDTLLINRRGTDLIRVGNNDESRNFNASSITAIQIFGYEGNDTITIEAGDLPVYALGGAGNDTINGGSGSETLTGGAGKDVIYGNAGNDTIYGSSGNDRVFGGEGSDRLNGEDGNDILDGGSGRDRIFGGEGNDYLHTRDRRPDYVDGGNGIDVGYLDNRFATEDWRDLEQFKFID